MAVPHIHTHKMVVLIKWSWTVALIHLLIGHILVAGIQTFIRVQYGAYEEDTGNIFVSCAWGCLLEKRDPTITQGNNTNPWANPCSFLLSLSLTLILSKKNCSFPPFMLSFWEHPYLGKSLFLSEIWGRTGFAVTFQEQEEVTEFSVSEFGWEVKWSKSSVPVRWLNGKRESLQC